MTLPPPPHAAIRPLETSHLNLKLENDRLAKLVLFYIHVCACQLKQYDREHREHVYVETSKRLFIHIM